MGEFEKGLEKYKRRTSLFSHPRGKAIERAFKRAKDKLKSCPIDPLAPNAQQRINETDEAISAYIAELDEVLKISEKSTMRFDALVLSKKRTR